ncbi:M17 family metallopeptidase [Chengkuizengella axinellae]|uniref:Probable cytosol aminopeptidase n=1 Tax=Chengkuizengella axinellae TaxID=3064388 RepID=A0ABT9IXX8_9BACL|nr:leucyl aminopeptidase family protein [Chengkuizengella sp. 2205SS18-9]MDP5274219.1 leucyl aminopeptidase family protein [Chengkuizengella sp. 2205SS18-9]
MEVELKTSNTNIMKVIPVVEGTNMISIPEWMMVKNQVHYFSPNEQTPSIITGLGVREQLSYEDLRNAAGETARFVKKMNTEALQISFEFVKETKLELEKVITAFVEGWILGRCEFQVYRTEVKEILPNRLIVNLEKTKEIEKAIQVGIMNANSQNFARDLCNLDPKNLNPDAYVEKIKEQFEGHEINVHIHEEKKLEEMKMNGILSVGRGSRYSSYLAEIQLCTDPTQPHITLIGKGVTFDTGGINLKKGRLLSGMRVDMGGSAAVFGAVELLKLRNEPVNITALLPIVENTPDANAFLPGEVIHYSNGLHVQVGNTDAEGRLIMADALLYAERFKSEIIIDIATLTGSIYSALGYKMAGVYGDEEVTESLKQIGNELGEYVWQMPLIEEYEQMLNSEYADISNNTTMTQAAHITAALFLRKFVPQVKWAHIDMAGTAESPITKGYHIKGPSGFGVRLLADFIINHNK